jgi:hypothetical protein
MESATTATMEPATSAPVSAAIGRRMSITVAIAIAPVSVAISRPTVVPAAIAVVAAAVSISVIPGAGPNEYSAEEPRRSIVPIRRTGIRIIAIIAIRAYRRRISIALINRGANSNSNRDLCMRVGRSRHQQNTQ